MADEADALSRALSSLARHLVHEEGLEATLERVARLACRTIGDCDADGITMVDNGKSTTAACTDDITLSIDGAQYDSGEGPCLEAYRQGTVFRVEPIDDDERWPEFVRSATAQASRDVIGQAKGIVMAQRGGGADDAFDVLRRASQRENKKLRDVAQAVV